MWVEKEFLSGDDRRSRVAAGLMEGPEEQKDGREEDKSGNSGGWRVSFGRRVAIRGDSEGGRVGGPSISSGNLCDSGVGGICGG